MKKTALFILVSIFIVSSVFAVDFDPTVMKISAAGMIQYNFDGTVLDIPVTVSGTPAGVLFSVFTKDKASEIVAVQNGHLGWHYVNKIDTCLYMGGLTQIDIGKSTLKWDGKDNDGGIVPKGDYTYYIYGYDSVNQKQLVNNFVSFGFNNNTATKVTHNEDGTPKSNPEFYLSENKWFDEENIKRKDAEIAVMNSALTKITIGYDPKDSTLVETTSIPGDIWGHHLEFQPTDHNYFYFWCPDRDGLIGRVGKYQWVPNGEAVIQTGWGEEGFAIYPLSGAVTVFNYTMGGLALIEDYIIVGWIDNKSTQAANYLAYILLDDGTFEREIDMSDRWYSVEDVEAGAQGHGGPTQLVARNNLLILSRFNACYREMVDPLFEDEEDFLMWGNDNGDYVGDHNFEEESERPWVCFDFAVGPYTYVTDADANLFSSFGSFDLGAVSFGLVAPDGTGIGYFAFAGETAANKKGTIYVDYDSSFDGIYTDNKSTGPEGETDGIWYIAHDSIKGVITSSPVGVEESSPTTFAVSQNSPNPFNPTTTISFTIPEAGIVNIDVFNVAGQKVDTITNEFMSAGSHSVTWSASAFSAGVYFYTVKSGDFSRTKKMTLLK